jgi:phosphoglycolate phosphatase
VTPAPRTLILFDIDGTLILTGGAGSRAITRAFSDYFQLPRCESPPMAGRTDRWILGQLADQHGVRLDEPAVAGIFDRYLQYLGDELRVPNPAARVLPGVTPLLRALASRADVHLALLTGNIEAGARLKLGCFDLWRYFGGGGYGDSAIEREALVDLALDSVAACAGLAFLPERTVIVGDTPLDIAAARAAGARSLGVATGTYDIEALRQAGADVVLPDLGILETALQALQDLGLAAPE